MRNLGIEMIPADSPEIRGRIERIFRIHQNRLPKGLTAHGITVMDDANRYIEQEYRAEINNKLIKPAAENGSAFVRWTGANLDDIFEKNT